MPVPAHPTGSLFWANQLHYFDGFCFEGFLESKNKHEMHFCTAIWQRFKISWEENSELLSLPRKMKKILKALFFAAIAKHLIQRVNFNRAPRFWGYIEISLFMKSLAIKCISLGTFYLCLVMNKLQFYTFCQLSQPHWKKTVVFKMLDWRSELRLSKWLTWCETKIKIRSFEEWKRGNKNGVERG